MNREADLNENGCPQKSCQMRRVNVPRMKIRTPVRWYSLSPVLNLGLEDVKPRVSRHCDERGTRRRAEDCDWIGDGLIDEVVDCHLKEEHLVDAGCAASRRVARWNDGARPDIF